MSRSSALVLVLALVLVACGGDTSGGVESGSDDSDGASSQQPSGDDDDAAAGGGGGDSVATHGFVEVGGTNYGFSFDEPGRCGLEGGEGRVVAQGYMDDGRQLVFTYGLPEETDDGEAHLQIIVYDENNEQVWYSSVGFLTDDIGSVSSISKSGDTVSISGQLQFVADGSLGEFTAEATCSQ